MANAFHRKPRGKADLGKRRRAIEAIRAGRRTVDRVLDRTLLKPVVGQYDSEAGKLVMRLGRGLRRYRGQSVTGQIADAVTTEVGGWLDKTYDRLGGLVSRGTREVLTESVQNVAGTFGKIMQSSSPLETVRESQRIIFEREKQLSKMRGQVFLSARNDTARDVAARLQGLAFEKRPVSEIIEEVGESLDGNVWRVERTVRTETSFGWNSAQRDGIKAIAGEFRGLHQRWTEQVDDLSGRPLDKRVGNDSIALHGQVVRPGRRFIMLPHAKAPAKMLGQSWYHPPNRPNDRAILVPWMADWGVPAWTYSAGQRVAM